MGGCASKPKEADLRPESLPSEAPAPVKAEAETVAQEDNNGGETQKEAPLVDLSEPKQEEGGDSSAESKVVDAEPAAVEVQTKSTEDKVEAAAKEPEVKVEAAKETTEPAKDAVKVVETPKADAAPSSEDKSDKSVAPLVTVTA